MQESSFPYDAIVLMSRDLPINELKFQKKIESRHRQSGERYTLDIDVPLIEIFGKKIARYVFEAMDTSGLEGKIAVAGTAGYGGSVEEHFPELVKGLSHDFFFVQHQGAIFLNAMACWDALKSAYRKNDGAMPSHTWICFGDLPLIGGHVDERLRSFGDPSTFLLHYHLVTKSTLQEFWRDFSHLFNDDLFDTELPQYDNKGNELWKETQDALADICSLDHTVPLMFSGERKMTGFWRYLGLLLEFKKMGDYIYNEKRVEERASSSMETQTFSQLLTWVIRALRAYINPIKLDRKLRRQGINPYFRNKLLTRVSRYLLPFYRGGPLSQIKKLGADLFNISYDSMVLSEITIPEFSMDVDSVQDCFRVAHRMYVAGNGNLDNIIDIEPNFKQFENEIRYHGTPILDYFGLDKEEFYADLYNKHRATVAYYRMTVEQKERVSERKKSDIIPHAEPVMQHPRFRHPSRMP